MKYIPNDPQFGHPVVELTRRNLETLLWMLNDGSGNATATKPSAPITVRAVENEAHYSDRDPGLLQMPNGEVI